MKNNNLTTLENAIYNSIPRLRGLSSGCIIETSADKKLIVLNIDNQEEIIICCDENGRNRILSIKSNFTIIGHPILLNDVLEWLKGFKKQNLELAYGFNLRGEFWDVDAYYMCEWDLSKPALSDQSQELIDTLTELIPK